MFKKFKKVDPKEVTCGQFADWLRKTLEASIKDSGIEWCCPVRDWGEGDCRYTVDGKIEEDTHTLWPVVFIQPGMNEGNIVTVAVSKAIGRYDTLCNIKVFADEATVWELGRTCHKFLLQFLWSHEVPWIVDLMDKVPNRLKYRLEQYQLDYRDESLYLTSNGDVEGVLAEAIPSEEVGLYLQDARIALNNNYLVEVSK